MKPVFRLAKSENGKFASPEVNPFTFSSLDSFQLELQSSLDSFQLESHTHM